MRRPIVGLISNYNHNYLFGSSVEIFQNIENRHLLQRNTPKQLDYITKYTVNKLNTEGKPKKKNSTIQDDKVITDVQG